MYLDGTLFRSLLESWYPPMFEITIMMCNFEVKISRSTNIFPLSLIDCFLKAVMIYVAASLVISKTCMERRATLIINKNRPPLWTGSIDHFHGPGPWTPCHEPRPWTLFYFCGKVLDRVHGHSLFNIMRNEQKQKLCKNKIKNKTSTTTKMPDWSVIFTINARISPQIQISAPLGISTPPKA